MKPLNMLGVIDYMKLLYFLGIAVAPTSWTLWQPYDWLLQDPSVRQQ